MRTWFPFFVLFFAPAAATACGMHIRVETHPADFMICGSVGAAVALLVLRKNVAELSRSYQLLTIAAFAILGLFVGMLFASETTLDWGRYTSVALFFFVLQSLAALSPVRGWIGRLTLALTLVVGMGISLILFIDTGEASKRAACQTREPAAQITF